MKQNKLAFTFVELMVVVTILSILLIIAFISIQDYSKSSRNSVRVTDIWIIKQSLWIFEVETWKYPISTNPEEITYKWWLIWYQGTFDEKVKMNLDNLSKVPIDPLFENEYDYSVINNQTKYQLWTIMEWWVFTNNTILSTTYALDYWDINSYVTWNYDLFDIKSQSWSDCYLVSIPSLFVNDYTSTWALLPWWYNHFIYDNSENITINYQNKLQNSYSWTTFWLQEVLSSCSVNTLDELNLYISKLALWYQQLIWTNNFDEIIYNFSDPTFKVWMINNLISNWINVNSNLRLVVMDPSWWNIFNDSFTWNDNTNLVWLHTPDTFWSWINTWSLLDTSYILNWNTLVKNDWLDWVIMPVPILPITSIDKTILFNVKNFAWWRIFVYISYFDENNFYWVELKQTWYNIINMVWGTQTWIYPISQTEAINTNSLVELNVSWNNIKLSINSIEKDNLIDPSATLNWSPSIKMVNVWSSIDNFTLIYK